MEQDYVEVGYDLGVNGRKVWLHKPTGLVVHDKEAFEKWLIELKEATARGDAAYHRWY